MIYTLTDNSGAVFYIGRTTNAPSRLSQHKVTYGPDCIMTVVQDNFRGTTPAQAEAKWIIHFRNLGFALENRHIDVGVNKSEWFKFRITPDDTALFKRCAEDAGLSISGWCRMTLKAAAKRG